LKARILDVVFRKFREAPSDHTEAQRALEGIGELYEIDGRAGDDVERRAELRRSESGRPRGA
jgi:hypothetical protein